MPCFVPHLGGQDGTAGGFRRYADIFVAGSVVQFVRQKGNWLLKLNYLVYRSYFLNRKVCHQEKLIAPEARFGRLYLNLNIYSDDLDGFPQF